METGRPISAADVTYVPADPGSYRDPSGRVYRHQGRVLRTVAECARAHYEALRDRGIYRDCIAAGMLVPTRELGDGAEVLAQADGARAAYVLEHDPIPYVSYPYEWPFELLKAAALAHLDLQIWLLDRDVSLSDASAYNVQFDGVEPIFIDFLSLRPYRAGEYWTAHSQFCEQFLNPLLLRAYCGVAHNDWYRGHLEGIPTADLAAVLPASSWTSWSALMHVHLQARLQRRAQARPQARRAGQKPRKGLARSAYKGMLRQLAGAIARLEPRRRPESAWSRYTETRSYSDEERARKDAFVREFVEKVQPKLLFDLGCNTGEYAELALRAGAERVIGFDSDHGALDAAVRRARKEKLRLTPLYLDAANAAPMQGWRQSERLGFQDRANCDAVLALALEHHLVIGRNIPLDQFLSWLCGLAPVGIVEFVDKSDPMVQNMLALREDIFPDYSLDAFRTSLNENATVISSQPVMGTARVLFWYDRRK